MPSVPGLSTRMGDHKGRPQGGTTSYGFRIWLSYPILSGNHATEKTCAASREQEGEVPLKGAPVPSAPGKPRLSQTPHAQLHAVKHPKGRPQGKMSRDMRCFPGTGGTGAPKRGTCPPCPREAAHKPNASCAAAKGDHKGRPQAETKGYGFRIKGYHKVDYKGKPQGKNTGYGFRLQDHNWRTQGQTTG